MKPGSDPRLLRLTMDGYLTAHWGATPCIKIVRTMWLDSPFKRIAQRIQMDIAAERRRVISLLGRARSRQVVRAQLSQRP